MVMGKSRKHFKRSDHYRTMAEGYGILRSPLAHSYKAAAEHYRKSDPALDPMLDSAEAVGLPAPKESERDAASR